MSSRLLMFIACVLAAAGLAEALLAPGAEDAARLVTAIAAPLLAAPLAWGRRAPAAALAAVAAVLAAQAALGGALAGGSVTTIAVLAVALFCAGRFAAAPLPLAGAAGLAAAIAATRIAADDAARPPRDALLTFAAVACPLLVGRWVRGQRQLQRELAERSARRERMRSRDARHAAEEERARIAADLQLAVAGGLREIAAEAGALRAQLARGRAHDSAERLAGIAATARTALADVRRVHGVLRHEGEGRRLVPPRPATADAISAPAPEAAPVPAGEAAALPRVPPAVLDAALAVAVAIVVAVELALSQSPVAALTALPIALPLLARRRMPLAAAAGVLGAIALQSLLVSPGSSRAQQARPARPRAGRRDRLRVGARHAGPAGRIAAAYPPRHA